MPWGTIGPDNVIPYQNAGVVPQSVMWIGINFYANRCPLLGELTIKETGAEVIKTNHDNFRPRNPIARTNAGYTSTAANIVVTDATLFQPGDLIEVDSERFLVTNINNTTSVGVAYAQEGTTQANHTNNTAIFLVTNARTGAQMDESAISRQPTVIDTWPQIVSSPYQIGGAFQATSSTFGGAVDARTRNKMIAMQHTMDDFESAMYYAKGQARNNTISNPTMKGAFNFCTTNVVTSPVNASSYKPSDFVRDTIQACYDKGGNPDTCIVSTSFLTGLHVWGFNFQQIVPAATALGVRIQQLYTPFLPGIKIIPAPHLKGGSAFCFNSKEVCIQMRRQLFDNERGNRGDLYEGEYIMDGCIDIENEHHQAVVSGITTFAVQS